MMSSSVIVTSTHVSNDMLFPSSGMQLLSALTQFLGVSIMAHCLSRRVACEELSSLRGWQDLTWARICVLLAFLDSWLFLFTSGVLIFGIGLDRSSIVCSFSIYVCIAFYGTSKLFIYCFLIEKVHVVWARTANAKRFRSPVYIISVITVALYAVVAALMFIGRVHYFRADGTCVTGVDLFASVPLLSYDLYVSVFLTTLFLWPLVKTGRIDPLLRRVARRTLLAAAVALSTSTANVLVMTMLRGKELGWVCLGSCGADVLCNALALFWVTQRTRPRFSPNIKIGGEGSHQGAADGNSKPRSIIPENHQESLPTFTPNINVTTQSKIQFNAHTTGKGNASLTPTHPGTHRPSHTRLHAVSHSKGSRSKWSIEPVASLFCRSEEEKDDDRQLEVTVTTEIVEESQLRAIP